MRRALIGFIVTLAVFVLASILLIFAIYAQAASWLLFVFGALVVVPIPLMMVLLFFVMKPLLDDDGT